MAHDIRLAGPWEYSATAEEAWIRCQLPWSVPAEAQTAILQRKFHRPSGLSESSVLEILFFASGQISSINVNGQQVAATDPSPSNPANAALTENRFDVTGSLREFNTVAVQLNAVDAIQVNSAVLRIME